MHPDHTDYLQINRRIYVAAVYARMRELYRGIRDASITDTMAIREFLAYDLPGEYYNIPEDATVAVTSVIKYILSNNLYGQFSTITSESYLAVPDIDSRNHYNRQGLPNAWPYTEVQIAGLNVIQAFKVLIILSMQTRAYVPTANWSDTISYVSSCNMQTRHHYNWICKESCDWFPWRAGVEIELDRATVKLAWSIYGILIPSENYRVHFENLIDIIPDIGLNLRLTMQQAEQVEERIMAEELWFDYTLVTGDK